MRSLTLLELGAQQRELTPAQQDAFCRLIGGRGRTVNAAARLAALPLSLWWGWHWLARVEWYFDEKTPDAGFFQYAAGQSYPDELTRIRADIRRQCR
jgi:hypothetical protein